MREALRVALLSVLFFGGLALLATPATAQGGGGTMECGEENGEVECDDEITVTATPPPPDPPPPDPPKPPPREPDPPPPENTCLTCHPPPHPVVITNPEEASKCFLQLQYLAAAERQIDEHCTWGSLNRRCNEARAMEEAAWQEVRKCQQG